jgi:hypothetical protein
MSKIIVILTSFFFSATVIAESPILFKPPSSGAPSAQRGGGTRGSSYTSVAIQALVPQEHIALTSQESPTLYWHISQAAPYNVEFSLSVENSGEIIVEDLLPPVTKAGIQSITLSAFNVKLQEGTTYLWSIALVVDPNDRAKDILISTAMRREHTIIDLNDAAQLAQAGFWYDTLHYVSDKKPSQVSALLKQIGITLGEK